jgi:hypothetical protein
MSHKIGPLPTHVSTADLARLLGTIPANLGALEAQGVLRQTSPGAWPLVASVRAFVRWRRGVESERQEARDSIDYIVSRD